jgi:hypothetical protein
MSRTIDLAVRHVGFVCSRGYCTHTSVCIRECEGPTQLCRQLSPFKSLVSDVINVVFNSGDALANLDQLYRMCARSVRFAVWTRYPERLFATRPLYAEWRVSTHVLLSSLLTAGAINFSTQDLSLLWCYTVSAPKESPEFRRHNDTLKHHAIVCLSTRRDVTFQKTWNFSSRANRTSAFLCVGSWPRSASRMLLMSCTADCECDPCNLNQTGNVRVT